MRRRVRPAVHVSYLLVALLGGAWPVWAQDAVPARLPLAVERRLAAELGVGPGDTVRVALTPEGPGAPAVVAAVYEPVPDPATILRKEFHVRLHLPDLAALLGAPDRVDRFGVQLRPGVSPDSAAAALNQLAFGFQAFSSGRIAAESSQTFQVVSRFHRAIAVISTMASAIFLLCIMLLKVEERRLDAAVMRFVGVRRRTIFLSLLLEACLVAVVGSVLGSGIAWVAETIINAFYQRAFETRLVFSAITADTLVFSVALSLGLGVAAGSLAAWRLVRTRPLVLWGRA